MLLTATAMGYCYRHGYFEKIGSMKDAVGSDRIVDLGVRRVDAALELVLAIYLTVTVDDECQRSELKIAGSINVGHLFFVTKL
jgi:hypothetical protein